MSLRLVPLTHSIWLQKFRKSDTNCLTWWTSSIFMWKRSRKSLCTPSILTIDSLRDCLHQHPRAQFQFFIYRYFPFARVVASWNFNRSPGISTNNLPQHHNRSFVAGCHHSRLLYCCGVELCVKSFRMTDMISIRSWPKKKLVHHSIHFCSYSK